MLLAPNVVIHNIEDQEFCIHNVFKLLLQLSRSLPKHLASDEVRESLSPGAQEMLEEVIRSPVLVLEESDTNTQKERPVTEVVDTVLSCVRMVKAASSFSSSRHCQQARASWRSLITALGIAILEDVLILEDIPFLKPRPRTKSEIHEVGDVEGKAIILLSVHLPRLARTQGDIDMDVNKSVSDCETNSCSRTSGDSFKTLNIPLDAHVLPGRGKRVECFLPVVCAADEDEINALVTSVVCQRHVCNISLPVVGVSLTRSSTTAKVVIGWAEGNDSIPTIHLAYSQKSGSLHPSMGLFDLMDPISALCFAQFVLGLQTQFSFIKENMKTPRTVNFCWRFDHMDRGHSHAEGGDASLEAWLSSLSRTEISEHCETPSDQGIQDSTMSNKKANSRQTMTTTDSSQLLQVPQVSLPTSTTSSRPKSEVSYYSASQFAKLNPPETLHPKQRGTHAWLWDRRTIKLHRIRLTNPDSDLREQINEMIDLYDQVTEFCWPKAWTTRIPQTGSNYEDIRTRLFQDFKEYKASTEDEVPTMEDDVCLSLTNNANILFKAIASARVNEHLAEVSETTESAMRSAWDDILKSMCCSPNEALSESFFMERQIPLPRNQAVELGNLFPWEDQVRLLDALTLEQYIGTAEYGLSREVRRDVLDTHSQASNIAATMNAQPYILQPEDRRFEPADAITDGVWCLSYSVSKPKSLDRRYKTEDQKATGESTKIIKWTASLLKLVLSIPTIARKCKETKGNNQPEPPEEVEGQHNACVMCPGVSESLPIFSALRIPGEGHLFPKLYLPLIFAEYKKSAEDLRQAFHQIQIYCTFGVELLAALGVTDFPVWGVVTGATKGSIIMAWKSSKSDEKKVPVATRSKNKPSARSNQTGYNILIDRYTRTFDLGQPLQALQFMSSVHRIYKLHKDMKNTLDERAVSSLLADRKMSLSLQNWLMARKEKVPS